MQTLSDAIFYCIIECFYVGFSLWDTFFSTERREIAAQNAFESKEAKHIFRMHRETAYANAKEKEKQKKIRFSHFDAWATSR